MKHIYLLLGIILSLYACRKETISPQADFSFRNDTASVFKMATWDTCTLFDHSLNADSSYWNTGNDTIVKGRKIVLSYPKSGTYTVTLTTKNNNGRIDSVSKKVIVLDRVLKKVIIKSIYWDTIPNRIPNFNATWPTTSYADVYVLIQNMKVGNEVHFPGPGGLAPDLPVIYKSPVLPHQYCNQNPLSLEIPVPGKVIMEKPGFGWGGYLVSMIAENAKGPYCLFSNMWSGSTFGIWVEDFANNRFMFKAGLFSFVEFECVYE